MAIVKAKPGTKGYTSALTHAARSINATYSFTGRWPTAREVADKWGIDVASAQRLIDRAKENRGGKSKGRTRYPGPTRSGKPGNYKYRRYYYGPKSAPKRVAGFVDPGYPMLPSSVPSMGQQLPGPTPAFLRALGIPFQK